ncbi:stage III sporulation protein AF [Paenibacillus antri]|uniref:Stage III sporulation protein AF n=1 Tax=Paenibacillus antri TaxID=2582848 RepID=A0A5R9GJD5_9BACL|nr:stage III sporulation protein AF [Paenibacillus antri]TLS52993.1 stage III sporulation protein AF [Paenibacillus antri]
MMEALTGWLKQIVLVVLLATFIDLLLPNRTMQRYVKLVVSLFILMTILSPVLQLLGSNANVRMLAASVGGWSVAGTAAPAPIGSSGSSGGSSMPALGELLSEGEAIARAQSERSIDMLENRIEAMVEEHVRSKHEAEASVEAAVDIDGDGLPTVKSIRIRVGASLAAAAAASAEVEGGGGAAEPAPEPSGGINIEPVVVEPVFVEPVRIGETRTEGAAADASAPAPVSAAERKAIAKSVAEAWAVPVSKVKVE